MTATGGPTPERIPLGQLLVGAGFITEAQLDDALYEGSQTGERLGEVVVRRRWASEDDVAKLLADQWELAYVDRASIFFDSTALSRLSREDAQRLEALPTRVQDGRIVVAVAEPTEQRLNALRRVIGDDTIVIVVPKSALEAGLHSELLASRGRAVRPVQPPAAPVSFAAPSPDPTALARAEEPPPVREPPRFEPPPVREAPRLVPAASPSPPPAAPPDPPPPALRPLTPPSHPGGTTSAPPESVAALAAQVRGVADAIASLADYEQKVAWLEAELDSRRRAMSEIKAHLEQIVRIIDRTV